jgi:arylsulfatase A-like enzyme
LESVHVDWDLPMSRLFLSGNIEDGNGRADPPYDPHWEMTALRDPLTGSPAKVPISPCPSHKHRHDFDGQTNKHIASWNVSASGVVPAWMQNKRLDSWDEWREDLGWQNRSAACVDLDDMIAAVLEGFETLGVLNNTFVFFSSECAPQSWPRSLVGATVYAASVS